MPRSYFSRFPETEYNGYEATNIMTSAKLTSKFTNAPFSYYRTTMKNDPRPDQVAGSYYDDPYMSWLVFYSNKIIDPYYHWAMSETNFNAFIEKKYGSIPKAQKTILEFRVSWEADSTEMSPAEFSARFGDYTDPHSKYWNPIYDVETEKVLYYVRKANEAVVNTNKMMLVGVSNNSPTKFASGDLIDIKIATNGTTVGTAEVTAANATSIYLKNILGDVANTYYLVMDEEDETYCRISDFSSASNTAADSWTIVNIDEEEYVYWEPHTAFDMEEELNTGRRSIKLVDSSLALEIADQLEKELNGIE